MFRPSMTVVLKNGERYDANGIQIVRASRYDEQGSALGSGSDIAFICSGSLTVKPSEDVERIEYRDHSAQYCGACDGSIGHILGVGEMVPIPKTRHN